MPKSGQRYATHAWPMVNRRKHAQRMPRQDDSRRLREANLRIATAPLLVLAMLSDVEQRLHAAATLKTSDGKPSPTGANSIRRVATRSSVFDHRPIKTSACCLWRRRRSLLVPKQTPISQKPHLAMADSDDMPLGMLFAIACRVYALGALVVTSHANESACQTWR